MTKLTLPFASWRLCVNSKTRITNMTARETSKNKGSLQKIGRHCGNTPIKNTVVFLTFDHRMDSYEWTATARAAVERF